jgi:hypothetical protein
MKTSHENKIAELIEDGNLMGAILHEAIRLSKCGGIDMDAHGKYGAHKTCIHVALQNISSHWTPLNKELKRDAKNLKHF